MSEYVDTTITCNPPRAVREVDRNARAVYWLALGTFAVGTEGFMIAGLLPDIASSLSVSQSTAGYLVTIFSLAYAISSPVLTALLAGINRRRLMIGSLGAFALANLVAASTHSFWSLAAARVLLAFSAGLYVPGANALAGTLVAPERRGKALAVINGGITLAIALGVPAGALIGNHLGWRSTFVGVALLSVIVTVILQLRLPAGIGAGLHTPTLKERIAVARRPAILWMLVTTTLWGLGAYTMYTYLSPFISHATHLPTAGVSAGLFILGVAAIGGVSLGGWGNDRFGANQVIPQALLVLALAFVALSTFAHVMSPQLAVPPIFAVLVVWALSGWSFYPAQQVRMIEAAGMSGAPIALSLHASFMYIGFSLGAAAGSLTLSLTGAANLGFVAALFVFGALVLFLSTARRSQLATR